MLADVIIIITILTAAICGLKNGFIRSVMGIVSFFCSLIAAWMFYPLLSEYYNGFFVGYYSRNVADSLNEIITDGLRLDLSTLFAEKPAAFTEITNRFHVDIEQLENSYYGFLDSNVADITASVSQAIVSKVSAALADILAFLSIFVGVFIVLKIAAFILDLIFKLPALSALNRFGGLVFGLISGCFYALLLSQILIQLSPLLPAVQPTLFRTAPADSSLIVNALQNLGIYDYPVLSQLGSMFGL